MTFPTVPSTAMPWLTVDQMVEADRLAIDEFGIGLLQMMEHAGAALAELTIALAPEEPITVLAGAGNNGGGGLCAARHLVNRGREVTIVMGSDHPRPAAARHLATLRAMGARVAAEPPSSTVAVDALVGYGLRGSLRGRAAELAAWASGVAMVVSLDFPSGHGAAGGLTADAVLTLALPKEGLAGLRPLYVADLGLPSALWAKLGLEVGPLFSAGRILQITQ